MLISLGKKELLGMLDLAIAAADVFDNSPKTEEVTRFSFKKMKFKTTVEPIYYPWYVWEVSLPKFLRLLKNDILISNKEEFFVETIPYVNLLNLIAGKDFDPFVIGEL